MKYLVFPKGFDPFVLADKENKRTTKENKRTTTYGGLWRNWTEEDVCFQLNLLKHARFAETVPIGQWSMPCFSTDTIEQAICALFGRKVYRQSLEEFELDA